MNALAHAMRLTRNGTVLAVIDMQEKLAASMQRDVFEGVVTNTKMLLSTAQVLGVPLIVTEQYPKGLGPTVSPLRETLSEAVIPIEKVEFSAVRATGFMDRLRDLGARHVILTGLEAHICVLQTAVELLQSGITVWIAQDAVCSRAKENWLASLNLLRQAGAIVAPTETIAFMLMERAGTAEFKEISKLFK